jgi:hypothetical protein
MLFHVALEGIPAEFGIGHGAMNRDEVRASSQKEMENRDVTVPQKDFGVLPHSLQVDHLGKAVRALTSADTEDPRDVRIGKHAIHVPGTDLVGTCQVSPPVEKALSTDRAEAQSLHSIHAALPLLVGDGVRHTQQTDKIPRAQRPSLVHGHPFLSSSVAEDAAQTSG